MGRPDESRTHATLLERVARSGDCDQEAWSRFVDQYGRKVYSWCLRWGLQAADAQDVTQIVLMKLAARMRNFTYDPRRSFRAWLKAVAHNTWKDFVGDLQRADVGPGGGGDLKRLDSVEAREDLVRGLEEQFDRELLDTAMQNVRGRAAAHNWRAFHLTAIEGIPAVEAARRLEMGIARVYAARSAIQQRIAEEYRTLEAEIEGE
jgi:RNA polymerase sigma-70 factor (ECF subfamily)